MEIKKILILSITVLATLGVNAQSKLSSTITDMLASVQQQIAEAQSAQKSMSVATDASQVCHVDTAAIQHDMVVSFNADGTVKTVDVIATLAEGATCPTAALEARGIRMTDQVRRFVFLVVPAEQLEFLETLEAFISLSENAVYHTMTDNTRSIVNVSNINGIDSETYSSDTPYTGKGVVVGIVDMGIDYNHIAFKDSEGNTRVKKVVDCGTAQNDIPTIATTAEDIAALTTDGSTDSDKSHGTHVAGCAAGSVVDATVDYSIGSRKLGGMAPEADLVLCGTYSLRDTYIIKSVDEIVKTAEELNEPCVINLSFGAVGGWHDGTSNTNTVINEYAKEGVVFCVSTGNDADAAWTVDKTIPAGESLKIIPRKNKSIYSTSTAYFLNQTITFHLPQCTDENDISYSFEVVDSITGDVSTLSDCPLLMLLDPSYEPSVNFRQDAYHNGWVKGSFTLSNCYFEDNRKFLVIKLENKTNSDLRVYAMSDYKVGGLYQDCFAYTDFPNYEYDRGTAGISINNTCSAENLISVGAYTTNPATTGYDGTTFDGNDRPSMIAMLGRRNSTAAYSNYGRDDFGKMHPDVIAPGTFVVAAYNQYDKSKATVTQKDTWIKQYICAYITDSEKKNHLFFRNQGTSMSVSVVSGIIALWLQAYPKLTAEKIREVIKHTSRTSVNGEAIIIHAGSTDQNKLQLGYGLIDAEAGLKFISENFVPSAIRGISNTEEPVAKTVKRFLGDKIVIEKNGKRYNTTGQAVIERKMDL